MQRVDFHSHLVPGVDDGARDLDEARSGLAAFRESGVTCVITTPHFQGSLTHRPAELAARLEELDRGWAALSELAESEFPELSVRRGVEVMLDTPSPDLGDERLRLDGGPFVLVEFPYMTVPPRSSDTISELRLQGWRPIIAHPERYMGVDVGFEVAEEWRRVGGRLQVNAGSIVGRYGTEVQRRALLLLEKGWVDYIASDFHSRGRTRLRRCREALEEMGGAEQAALLMEVNPARLVAGEDPVPVPALRPRRSLWRRLRKVFQ